MKVRLVKEDVYIPDWNENKDLPPEEQIKVHYRYLTAKEREKFIYSKPIKLTQSVGKADDAIGNIELVQDTFGLFRAATIKIENLESEEGKQLTPEEIITLPDSCGFGSLIAEIGGMIANLQVDKKK